MAHNFNFASTLSKCKDPSDFAYCVCVVYSCGYSQPNRKQISVELLEKGIARADCSSMVSWVLYMGGFLPECPWFYTAVEREYLQENNFTELDCDIFAPKRNDVLWRSGHTGIYIGEGLVAELIHDENYDAGWEGEEAGDQTGDESRIISYSPYEWEYILRYNGQDDEQEDDSESEDIMSMTFIFRPNDDEKQPLMFYDGGFISTIENDDERVAIQEAYKKATGKDIPLFSIGTKEAPYGTRFMAVVQRKWDLLDRFNVITDALTWDLRKRFDVVTESINVITDLAQRICRKVGA